MRVVVVVVPLQNQVFVPSLRPVKSLAKKPQSGSFEAKSGDKDNEKRGKSSHSKGRKKPNGKQADAVKAGNKKSKKKATKKAKRPGKNARKRNSRGANNT
jgi:ribonuclease R